MQDVEARGLDMLCKSLQEVLKEAPEMQRAAHEQLGDEMQNAVRGHVRDLINDRRGKISGWQRARVGSGGGYAAVRAAESPTGPNGAGAVTNYLENGHVKRRNSLHSQTKDKRTRRIRAQAGGNWVRGRGFYVTSRADLPRLLQRTANNLADQIADKLR